MPVGKKLESVTLVNRSPVTQPATLRKLGLPRSTFYRGQQRYRWQGEVGLVDRRPEPASVWNRRRPAEPAAVLAEALRQPDLSSRAGQAHPITLAFYPLMYRQDQHRRPGAVEATSTQPGMTMGQEGSPG